MPTFTRLLALLLLALAAFSLSEYYQSLDEERPSSLMANVWLAVIAGPVGWIFVGPRIDRSFMRGLTTVVQGYLVTFLLGLVLAGMLDIFTAKGVRHRTFTDVFTALFSDMQRHVLRMLASDMPWLMLGSICVTGFVLVAVFRYSESQRFAK